MLIKKAYFIVKANIYWLKVIFLIKINIFICIKGLFFLKTTYLFV